MGDNEGEKVSVKKVNEEDTIAKWWFFTTFLWFAFFASFGFILAIKFFNPYFLDDAAWLTFGRIRPAHVNGVAFGFLSTGLLGSMYYIFPKLADSKLFAPKLGKASVVLWNVAVLAGILLILAGNTQAREYAELPWIIDVGVMATLVLMAINVIGTLVKRNEKKLYVSTWYFAGTLLWFPIVYLIGNVMWRPPEGALFGIQDAIFNWYYGHNVLGLWFTTLGLGIWYFAVPKILNRPLYSHLLSLIAFFSIAFFYTGVGGHHLLQAPIPEWLKTIAVVMSILMLVPVITFATNILLTMRGYWSRVVYNTPLKFIMAAFFMYVLASFQGSFQAFRTTNMYLHFSQWPVGHAHIALLGGFGFLGVGMVYWLLPYILDRQIFSKKLMDLSWWLAILGFITFFLGMILAGLVANASWWQHIHVAIALTELQPYFILRAMGGGIIVAASYIFMINILATFIRAWHPPEEEEVFEEKLELSKRRYSKSMRRSQEHLNLKIVAFGGLAVFLIMTFMVVAMPYMYTAVEPSNVAHEYTSQQAEGREIFKNLGCVYCHSQFTRPQDWALGNTSQKGDYYYDSPHFLGTERTGPNLAKIGGKRPSEWHRIHDIDARKVSPSSIMPPLDFLSEHELNALVAYVQNLGSEDLDPQSFQPRPPEKYRGKENPYHHLMMEANQFYNKENQTFNGSQEMAREFASAFEKGKENFTIRCLACHGAAGNGMGPYSRNVVTRPANLHERLTKYPTPDAPFHLWRVSEGVPGTAMPIWKKTLSEDDIWFINLYEMSFINGAIRTLDEEVSDEKSLEYANRTNIKPSIGGTEHQFEHGKELYGLYCAQCHGEEGQGNGPASITSQDGYISPQPANLTEAGENLKFFGQYVWKVKEGVETTNMPPWKFVFTDEEMNNTIFYIQSFAPQEAYDTKWGPQYQSEFARNLNVEEVHEEEMHEEEMQGEEGHEEEGHNE